MDIKLMNYILAYFQKLVIVEKNESLFSDTKINGTTEGKRDLGAVIGSNDLRTKYVNGKVTGWCSELKVLSKFEKLQPQAAYAAYFFFLVNKTNLVTFYEPNQK